jgi:plasmid maintenance system antidote protein VapI
MAVRIGRTAATLPERWLFMQAKLDMWYVKDEKLKVKSLQSESVI